MMGGLESALVAIVFEPVHGTDTVRFVDQVLRHYRRHGIRVRAVLSDNVPRYKGSTLCAHLAAKSLTHVRVPPRSPNHSAVVKRFCGTILQECWQSAPCDHDKPQSHLSPRVTVRKG